MRDKYDSFLPFMLALCFRMLDIDAKYTFAKFGDSLTAKITGTFPCLYIPSLPRTPWYSP